MTMTSWTRAVFPTQVGVILADAVAWIIVEGIPHASGGDPYAIRSTKNQYKYSPRKWG